MFRGVLARRYCKRLHAVYVIVSRYRCYKLRYYLADIFNTFKYVLYYKLQSSQKLKIINNTLIGLEMLKKEKI